MTDHLERKYTYEINFGGMLLASIFIICFGVSFFYLIDNIFAFYSNIQPDQYWRSVERCYDKDILGYDLSSTVCEDVIPNITVSGFISALFGAFGLIIIQAFPPVERSLR